MEEDNVKKLKIALQNYGLMPGKKGK